MKLYVVYSSSIIALFSVDVDEFKNVLDLPKHGVKLYALNVSETNADILRVSSSSRASLTLKQQNS